MKVSREEMAQNRERILDAAASLFRARGFAAVSVAEVMKAAGLTHGGFYGHFASKDDLIAKSLTHVFGKGSAGLPDVAGYLDAYLSSAHRAAPASGCPMAALASETARLGADARGAMSEGTRRQFDRLAEAICPDDPSSARRQAIGTWSAMVGALILARSCDDAALSDEILRETRAWIADASSEGTTA